MQIAIRQVLPAFEHKLPRLLAVVANGVVKRFYGRCLRHLATSALPPMPAGAGSLALFQTFFQAPGDNQPVGYAVAVSGIFAVGGGR